MPTPETDGEAFEYVFEQRVRASQVDRYYKLSDQLHALASRQPGFIRQERRLVGEEDGVQRFETTLKFDSAAHCLDWIDHPERRRLLHLEEEEAGFAFTGRGNWDGYARWLSRRLAAEPPKWKINLLVLLTLYPTVMFLTPLLRITMGGFTVPSVMLVSNALCVAGTSWLFVPLVSRLYLQWLEGGRSTRFQILAGLSVFAILAALWLSFRLLPASLW